MEEQVYLKYGAKVSQKLYLYSFHVLILFILT